MSKIIENSDQIVSKIIEKSDQIVSKIIEKSGQIVSKIIEKIVVADLDEAVAFTEEASFHDRNRCRGFRCLINDINHHHHH